MKRILRKSKSKGKADASSVVSSEGVTALQLQVGEYVIKEKDLPKAHKAAWTGDLSKIRNFGNKRQDLNALDKSNRTPLHLACYNGQVEVVKYLVANGAKLNVCDADQRSPLMRAVQAGKFDIAEHLLRQNADPSLIDINGDTALHIAVYSGQQDAVRILTSYGAMLDAANKQGCTPLHAATSLANAEILELLLEKDADVNVQDSANRTPLMLACQADQIGIVKMLLEYKADPNIRDEKGWTANDHAIMGGFHGCSHLIEERQTIKRAPSGTALSGTGLFGSTSNSTDALGFPLGGPVATASDISGDNEDDLSINKRSDDDDSWAASNSEFDDPAPKKNQNLPGIKDSLPVKKVNNDLPDRGKPQVTPRNDIMREIDSLDRQSLQDNKLTGRSSHHGSEIVEDDNQTPRGRARAISSGSISDWDDDESDILDDLSSKKASRIPLRVGSQKSINRDDPSSLSPIQQKDSKKGLSKDDDEDPPSEEKGAAPNEVKSQGKGQPSLAKKSVEQPKAKDDVFDEDSDSDWDTEDDDILPSDNSGGNIGTGYMPSQLQGSSVFPRRDSGSPSPREKRNMDGATGAMPAHKDSVGSEEDLPEMKGSVKESNKAAQKQMEAEKGETGTREKTEQIPVLGTDQNGITQQEKEFPADSRASNNDDKAETVLMKQKLQNELESIVQEKREMEAARKRQELLFAEKLREVEDKEDVMKRQQEKKMEELVAEKNRLEEEVKRQEAAADMAKRKLEDENRKLNEEFERKRMEAEKEKEAELQRVEEEKRRLREELMTERHQMEEERRKVDQERMVRAEMETEVKEQNRSREQEELSRIQREKDKMERALREERETLELERKRMQRERAEEKQALDLEREQMAKERMEMERSQKEGKAGLDAEKERLMEEKTALEVSREKAANLEQEQKRLEKERVRIGEAKREAEKVERDKLLRLEEERQELVDARREAEKITREKKTLEEAKKNLEEEQKALDATRKDEARKLEAEKDRLELEKQNVLIAKQEKENFERERRNLEEEKKKLESVKRGEMDLVEFERQKLDQERAHLEKSRKDREDQISRERDQMSREREELDKGKKELEEWKMKEEAIRKHEEEKLESEKQRLEAKRREEDENMKNMMLKVKKLSERNLLLEREAEMKLEANKNKTAFESPSGPAEVVDGLSSRVNQSERFESRTYQGVNGLQQNGFTNGTSDTVVGGQKDLAGVLKEDDSVGSDGDSDSPVVDKDVVASLRSKNNGPIRKEAWLPGSLHGGIGPVSRGLQNRMLSSNNNGNGNPSSSLNTFQELMEEYDGLDYSSSSMGDGDEEGDGSLVNISPVGASTPLVPGGTLPLTSTFQMSQNGATTQMQSVIQDLRYRIAREKQSARMAQNKVRQMGEEKEDILHKLDELVKERQHLKETNLNLEKKLQSFIHEIEGEREQRGNAELLLKKTKEQLMKKERQLNDEHQVREQAELALCKMQVDFKMMQNTVQQLEAERDRLHHQMVENESSHKYQQKLMETQQMKQEAIYESGSVVLLEAADESRKAAWSQSEKLKEELHSMKVEMECLQFKYKGNEGALTNQIQELESKLDDLRQEQIVNEDALHHASQAFHAQLMAVKMENGQLKASLEQGQHKEDELTKKLDLLVRDNGKLQRECDDITKIQQELERAAKSEIEKLDGLVDKKQQELNHLKENAKSNEKTIRSMEEKISNLKQQLGIANGALLDRTNQLNTFQREMDRKLLSEQGHDKIIHMEREEKAKAMARADSLTESLRRAEEEISSLKKDLERMRDQTHQKERDSENAKERLNSTISEVQKEKDQVRSLWEEKHASMSANLQSLKDSLAQSQGGLREKEAEIRSLHQQLTENERKLCLAEANMTVLQKTSDNYERESKDSQNELRDMKGKIADLEMDKGRLEAQLGDLQKSLKDIEKQFTDSSDELSKAKKSLEQQDIDLRKMQELEREKARLEVAVEQERDRTHNLKMELDHALQMKNNLEVLLSQLKNTNVHIGEQLTLETAAKDMMSQEAEEHKELWESEIKSKSKLGLRLSQLQRTRVNQQSQIEEERHKTLRALEAKKQITGKLEAEKERNHQLDQTNLLLKSKLKLAKRKLKELEVPEAKIKSIQTDFERERFNLEAALATQRKQLENANEKLERDLTERQRLDQKNSSLELELASLQSLQKKKKDLSKENKRLEEELADTRRDIQENYIEKGELEIYKKSLNLQTTHDLNAKLAQINNYFDEQTKARDSMDRANQNTEAEMRKELEASISGLKSELANLRSTHSDLISKKETLEAELQRYKSLFQKESEKTLRLEEELEQLQRRIMELESQIRIEKQKVLQRTEPPTLDAQPQVKYRPVQQQPNSVDDITHQVREELSRSISRHMESATADSDSQFRGQSPVLGGYTHTSASPDTVYMALLKKNYFV